jgi:ribosomal protein S18 acetylase RimI-like enzyme
MSLTIRAAERADVPAVLELWRQTAAFRSATDDERGLLALLDQDLQSLLVAESGGEIAGAVIAAWDGWRGNLYRLAVLASHRRRGVARELVSAGERHLRSQGARRISALAVESESDVGGFWESVGYAPDPDVARFVKNLDR